MKTNIEQADLGERSKEEEPLTDGPVSNANNMSFCDKIKFVATNTTVEPVLALFISSSVFAALAIQNLNLEKACRVNLNYSDTVCTALKMRQRDNFTGEEAEVQKIIAATMSWKKIISAVFPTILVMFIGAWSDKTGQRKICMLLPIFGEFMASILCLVNTYYFYEIPVEWTVFCEVIFTSLTGGWHTMTIGVYSYLGDITTKEMRTFRFGILSFGLTLGFPVGMALSGIILKLMGYYVVFTISATMKFLIFCYVLFYLEDHTWLNNNAKAQRKGVLSSLVEFFDYRSLQLTFGLMFRNTPKGRRTRMCLVLLVVCLNFIPIDGEMCVMYIFTRYRFNWNEINFSIFKTFHLITHSIGTMFSISVFAKRMKLDDAVLGIISATSKSLGSLVLVLAQNDFHLYLSSLLEILNGTTLVALRSIASKLVTYQQLGRVYSLFAMVECITPLVAGPVYSQVYKATLSTLPGAVFLISVMAMLPVVGIFGWIYVQHRKDSKAARLFSDTTNIEAPLNAE